MKENVLEILVGSVVLILSFVFVIFTLSNTGFQQKGKFINAEFGNVAGLKVGDDVLIAGIKVGEVSSNTLDSKSYLAVVKLNLQNNIFIPEDSVAKISSASLLGGQYVEIIPGASDEMLKDDETIYDTRDPVSLTDLLGQAVFSATDWFKKVYLKYNKFFISLILIFSFKISNASWINFEGAQFNALDKITARIKKLEIYLNEEQVLGSLTIILKSCQNRPPDFLPESAAYVEIYDNLNQNFNDNNLIFSGWMFSSSPAISALEHPVYDISLISCK